MNLRAARRNLRRKLKQFLPARFRDMRSLEYFADGLGIRGKNMGHFEDPKFRAAWQFAFEGNREGWVRRGEPPDLRWRAHVCCWAASNGLTLAGDFVECGVHTGLLSMTVCHYLDFAKQPRRFFLYDTFEGIPLKGLSGADEETARFMNDRLYSDVWEIAQRNFAGYPNCELVRGALPGTIEENGPEAIAYLSIDLNSATFERQTIEALWPRIVPGAVIVIDDYAFQHHDRQYRMWNEFAAEHGTAVLTVPTGQGLLIRPPA